MTVAGGTPVTAVACPLFDLRGGGAETQGSWG
ncbi:hypothetical protein FHR90_000234 [Endobacter medicaginis]|uniref:Uncharacterized protein n=1 Tax=Endobacter medicaginis TaxID=1181271 RepID=A0A839UQG6_9PROT|nr:hypothetical protein [Endobacter medicaginis]